MMALLDLDIMKRHLRVWHNDDDDEIGLYGAAAEGIVLEYLDRPVLAEGVTPPAEGDDGYDEFAINVKPEIKAAMLLVLGDLYENREPDPKASGEVVLQPVVRRLLAPYRVWRSPPIEDEECFVR